MRKQLLKDPRSPLLKLLYKWDDSGDSDSD